MRGMWANFTKLKSSNRRVIPCSGASTSQETEGRIDQQVVGSLYLAALDGLRFLAFLLVFLHHLPRTFAVLSTASRVGWVGVEIFFAISSFLFFYLLAAEQQACGEIDIPKFYWRRLLRIYPLMVLFPFLMLALFTGFQPQYYSDVAGNIFAIENFLIWVTWLQQTPL